MTKIAKITYPTPRGERCIPVVLPFSGRGEQIVRVAEADGCTDTAIVRGQLAQLDA